MLRLKNLKAKACRGIIDGPELHFESGGLLLCGSNGMGKSSFIDAIEKVLTGKCSSLDTGDQSISWTKHGTHIESKKPPEIEITLTDGNKNVSVKLDTYPPTLDKNIQTFLGVASQQSFILRRRTLLNFIDANPKNVTRPLKVSSTLTNSLLLKASSKNWWALVRQSFKEHKTISGKMRRRFERSLS